MHILMKGINKSFGENQVLHDAFIEIQPGEVHALMGENGAGKSTLMNILTGVHTKDSGTILIDDMEIEFTGPKEAEDQGIAFIHQELNVLQDLTVEENLFLNKEIAGPLGIVNRKAMIEASEKALKILNTAISPKSVMRDLSIGQQQLVEIVKALMVNVETIIMDEPTAALTSSETKILFDVIRELKSRGVSIIYISHRMEEIFQISDRITVMRDGQYIGTKITAETNDNELVKMMIGRDLSNRYPERESNIGDTLLKVENLRLEELVKDVSFEVKKGEILGFSGLMGSGRSEIMHALFGNKKIIQGNIYLEGKEIKLSDSADAIKHGIGFVTEDRKNEGLLLDKSIRENLALTNLKEISNNGIINRQVEKDVSDGAVEMFNIVTDTIENHTSSLSGGNQQKVVIAKWVLANPSLLILDEPTRGVDVGAKEEIYQIMNDLVSQGIAIIMVSSDLPEVIGMSDRVAVMWQGTLKGILIKDQISEENIMTLATGGSIV